jgi:hypothetical protein
MNGQLSSVSQALVTGYAALSRLSKQEGLSPLSR